jgi:hypothetical protein
MFAFISRMDTSICLKLGMLISWNQIEILERSKLRKVSWVRVISVARKLSTIEEQCQDQSCLFQWGYYGNKSHNPKNVSCVFSPCEGVFCSLELGKIEEQHQDQSCLFWQGDYRNKGHNPKELSWFWVMVKLVSLAQKLSVIEEWRQDQSCLFLRGDTGTKVITQKNRSWVRVPVKMVPLDH